ncbi:putative xyloglucan endotransglucosylase/hydrolase protein 32 [Carex littledalei]|uniref:Xyloglucan endotransglucosylase/hydrolase n=1 Tax=Carex littledalei TaxID=544730 RepID=A0A833VD82_9POAL|nr:putative xyloglucan endotransglucosylase/hydrolase protein 32 [Carex littledalei]
MDSLLLPFLLFVVLFHCTNAQPSPGYYPSSKFRSIAFSQGYSNLWGSQHQSPSQDQSALTIWLDKSSGSGFKSIKSYRNGYFGASMKVQAGYTAGVNNAFYLSNNQQYPGFYVDDIPIRRYENKVDGTFPDREMWMYGSIWDASDWATDNGKYRADYQYQPFAVHFTNFKIGGCTTDSSTSCHPVPASGTGSVLSDQQYQAMLWAQKNSMTYYYCQDSSKDRSLYPEC